jgi:hypothetical protein
MCGEDVVCVPSRRGASECMRLCRFENGDEDCTGGGECRFSDFLEDDIGVCR